MLLVSKKWLACLASTLLIGSLSCASSPERPAGRPTCPKPGADAAIEFAHFIEEGKYPNLDAWIEDLQVYCFMEEIKDVPDPR